MYPGLRLGFVEDVKWGNIGALTSTEFRASLWGNPDGVPITKSIAGRGGGASVITPGQRDLEWGGRAEVSRG